MVFGAIVGIIAGYRGGWLDSLIGRISEVFLALPLLLGGILFLYTFPIEITTPFAVAVSKVAFVIALLSWPLITRLMRSSVLQVKPNDYVQAARALGASPMRIIRSHIVPNSLASVIVVSTINLGVFISLEATLSFLGIGLQPPIISWGSQISDASGIGLVLTAPHMLIFPSIFLSLTVLAFIMLGDVVRDALDPRTAMRGPTMSSQVEVLGTRGEWRPADGLLLEVDDLHVEFRTRDGVAKAINGVTFDLHEGETLAILGESGSGKSVTAQAIMGILDSPPGFITGGELRYCGKNMLAMTEEQRRRIRGPEIAMIFQDALSALNPVFSVGYQIAEMFRKHRGMNKSDAQAEAIELMERVQIPGAAQRVNDYPHQFSGGMRQRIMIAMAIALDPEVLIADEPTTALDVTVQAQIMELLAGSPGRTQDGADPDHPRPRRRRRRRGPDRGDVRRPDRRTVGDLRAVPQAGPPVHEGSARLDPAAGPEGPGARRDRRAAAQSDEDPGGLRVQPALSLRPRRLS